MQFVGRYENIDFYKYSPRLFKPYYMDYPYDHHPKYESRIVHKIRMMIEYLRGGYSVFYMLKYGEVAGHIVVTNGGRRLLLSQKEDIVLGPIFVSPAFRGKGIGTIGINIVLNKLDLKYRFAYEFIKHDNIASIRTVEKNGYERVCRVKERGLLKKLVESTDGDYILYRYSKNK